MKTITDLDGVYAGAVASGIKKDKLDLAFIFIPKVYSTAGVFTKNKFIAPCLELTKKNLNKKNFKAIIINSGNANAATGKQGLKNAKKTAEIAAKILDIKAAEIGVASTGIIGVQLPMEKLEIGLDKLLANPLVKKGNLVAEAIKTTDLITKEVYVAEIIDGKEIVIAGVAKGSGMIAPNMGTMLAFLVTNAKISPKNLKSFLKDSVDDSFNMVSVDTDSSTNDMVLLSSTGENELNFNSINNIKAFQALLDQATIELARLIAIDGEGAEHLIEVNINGASKRKEAKKLALNVVNSPLVKTAVHGADPNWGRVLAALGKDPDLKVKPHLVDLYIQGYQIIEQGEILSFNRDELILALKQKEVKINIDLNIAKGQATAWGCDLTKGYIDINSKYN
ncbi:MAG: bifunctional glutamate N-acetyltransferase/amino-acid acetyltransferase ArgJ [Candidatus Margulisiibacteriota bacterium]